VPQAQEKEQGTSCGHQGEEKNVAPLQGEMGPPSGRREQRLFPKKKPLQSRRRSRTGVGKDREM